jgi:two-component system, NtrC family, sensor kinase
MAPLLDRLPTILVLCALLGIFISLRNHAKSHAVRLWMVAWAFILAHFVAQPFETGSHLQQMIFGAVDLCGLVLSATVFTASAAETLVENRRWRYIYYALVGVPALLCAAAASFELDNRWLFAICLALTFFSGAALLIRLRWTTSQAFWLGVIVPVAIGVGTSAAALRHSYQPGILALLALGFALPGIGFANTYRRWSAGVITTTAGFLCWGSVFPLAALADALLPTLHLNPEFWNVPKFFVAFGMILTLLEDKSLSLETANQREHEATQQLQMFAHVTSQLLVGADPRQLCGEISDVITRHSTFRRVAILVEDDEGQLNVVGASGLLPEARAELEQKALRWKTSDIAAVCAVGRRIGPNSVHLKYEQLARYEPVRSILAYAINPYWQNGDEIFVPLRSPSGRCLGCISADDPREVSRVTPEELSKIELLAADLAVSLENKTLQQQLIRSEKLAALGKLVSGTAHELNNPLTSIGGFAELLKDEITSPGARDKLDKITRETRRMHAIIDKLLRFARRKSLQQSPVDLAAVAQDALGLCEYKLRAEKVQVETSIADLLPLTIGDEQQMRQVFVNLLSNSIEAMQESGEKRLRVEIYARDEKLCVRLTDSGPGFPDLNRAFDPFYTTKPVGKGTGLGLSICYGLIREHGGDIYAENLQPSGAAVVIELPVKQSASAEPALQP